MYSRPAFNRIFRFVVLIMLVLFNYASAYSQDIINPQKANENIYRVRTKQFNEFIDRFNYKTDFYGNPVDSIFRIKMPRGKMIDILFDLKDPRTEPSNKNYSDNYIKTKAQFAGEVIQKDISVYKYSPNIIAEARSRIIYKGTPYTISIFLNQEIVGNDMVKWVILNVKGDVIDTFKPDTSLIRFIPPSSNETDFINLRRALEDIDHLQYYASEEFRPDLLSVFFYCISTGSIKYEYVEEIIYHIIDIPGWCIKVKEFNRTEMNSGWLIYDVAKNDLELKDYLINLK